MKQAVLLECDGLPGPVSFVNCAALLDVLARCYLNWPFAVCHGDATPVIEVHGDANGFSMRSVQHPQPVRQRDPVDMACALIAELYWPLLESNRELLCLHGAAAEFSGNLVAFPNRYRAGKSLLSACLAAMGTRLYTDDVLPLVKDTGLGLAMGVRPRLRTPLPEDLSPRMREWFRARWGPSSKRYVYLELDSNEMAPAGQSLPISAFVVLKRSEVGSTGLGEVSRGQVLRQVIWQNFARDLHSATIVERLRGLVEECSCYELTYRRAEEAAELLQSTFGAWTFPKQLPTAIDEGKERPRSTPHRCASVAPDQHVQRPGVFQTMIDGERFLASADGKAVYHLNTIGSGIWQALADPMTVENLVELVGAAFPSIDAATIEADVKNLISDLQSRELLLSGDDADSPPGHQSG